MKVTLKASLFSGFIWTAFQTVGTKLISLAAQLALAWLLVPDDFGKVGIAFSITGIIFLIQNFGLSDVLISRGKSFSNVFHLSKTISFIMGLICLVFTIAAAFIAEIVYNDSEIKNIILIFCLSVPFSAMAVVPDAKLRIDLKFKKLSIIRVSEFLVAQLSIIIFVLLNFGVYSFVLGPLLGSILKYIAVHKVSKLPHTFKFTLHHWKFIFSNSLFGFFHSICQSAIRQTDYLILGLFVTKAEVGIYFLAYSLSVQVIGFLVNSLSPILFPSLMKIPKNEIQRIKKVLLKITVVFSFLGMPFAMWQTTVIEPMVYLFFEEKWYKMILIVQILSLGIGFNVISSLWAPALKLKSEFKKQAKFSFLSLLFFLSLIIPFSYKLGNVGLAIAVSIYFFIMGPSLLYASFKSFQIQFKTLIIIVLKYFSFSLIVFGGIYYLTKTFQFHHYLSLIFNGIFAPLIYLILLYILDSSFREFIEETGVKKKIKLKKLNV